MNVGELKLALAELPDDTEVILQKDAEGNGFSPLEGADPDAVYVADTTYYGEVFSTAWSAEDACKSDAEWSELLAKPHCLVLYPVN